MGDRATRSSGCSLYPLLLKNRSLSSRDKVIGEQKFVSFSLFPAPCESCTCPEDQAFLAQIGFFLLRSIDFSLPPVCLSLWGKILLSL